jgi:hypothetical protein
VPNLLGLYQYYRLMSFSASKQGRNVKEPSFMALHVVMVLALPWGCTVVWHVLLGHTLMLMRRCIRGAAGITLQAPDKGGVGLGNAGELQLGEGGT